MYILGAWDSDGVYAPDKVREGFGESFRGAQVRRSTEVGKLVFPVVACIS